MRTLFIHAGGAKTGTSALQNCFERNADLLRAHGIAYEHTLNIEDEHIITSGNGVPLYAALANDGSDDAICAILTSYLANHAIGICSCEALHQLTHAHWARLLELAALRQIDIHIIFFVRNVEPCLSSQYDQLLKRHGEFREYLAYLNYAEWDHFRTLKELAELKERANITVLHYDSHRERLLESFLNVIQPGKNLAVLFPSLKQVNRSLSEPEREIMRLVNLISNDRFSQELSDILLYTANRVRSPPPLTEQLSSLIAQRFSRKVHWVNDVYFNGKPVVTLENQKLELAKANTQREKVFSKYHTFSDAPPKYKRILKRVLELIRCINIPQSNDETVALQSYQTALKWAVQKLLLQDRERIIKKLRMTANSNSAAALIQQFPEFNPIEYLLLNQDVLDSNLEACDHYMRYGLKEGRQARFPN